MLHKCLCSLRVEKLQKVKNNLFIFVEVKLSLCFTRKGGYTNSPHGGFAGTSFFDNRIAACPSQNAPYTFLKCQAYNQNPYIYKNFTQNEKGSSIFLSPFTSESKSSTSLHCKKIVLRLCDTLMSIISAYSPCQESFPSTNSEDGE